MKFYERYIPGKTILDDFIELEETSLDEIRKLSNANEYVDLRDRFYAFAYANGMDIDDMVSITGKTRPNFYHSFHKPRFKAYMKKYKEMI